MYNKKISNRWSPVITVYDIEHAYQIITGSKQPYHYFKVCLKIYWKDINSILSFGHYYKYILFPSKGSFYDKIIIINTDSDEPVSDIRFGGSPMHFRISSHYNVISYHDILSVESHRTWLGKPYLRMIYKNEYGDKHLTQFLVMSRVNVTRKPTEYQKESDSGLLSDLLTELLK